MIAKLHTLLNQLILISLLILGLYGQAQDAPFNCDSNAYLFQFNDVYAIDLASGNSYLAATDITTGKINATAYNPTDGYIWGSLSTPEKTIVRIGNNFETTTFYIDELPTNNRYVGDVNQDGVYYLKGGGTAYYKIDLNPISNTYTQHISTETLSQNISIHDWAFNAVDVNLYAVEKGTNILYRINPITSNVTSLGEVPILSGLNYTYGAVYFDDEGRFYISANQTGTIYVIQSVQDLEENISMDSNLFAFGPSSSSNDGARCPTAPVSQEICDNGIDDDGDGLIDCQDPSCSGFGNCDIISAPKTANDGGLESNGRLSEAINKRNFNRAKSSYKFDLNKAKKVLKNSAEYVTKSTVNNFQLQIFVPLTTINEDYALDSTPTDLLNITNATEVYSVDYIQDESSIASILILKTENGVYEHTKYVCDRLLGSELISVSTMEILGESFIKSIIKNIDGSYEYVLSLSAKMVNDNNNFSIESHWNLDLYEEDVVFYNFQIWSNSIDDLYLLAEEVLNLLNNQKPILEYNNSAPPTVFVRKGKYLNGALNLQIINTNATNNVYLDAGHRTTETSDFYYTSSSLNLNENYISNLQIPTGNIFDIGFRIGDGVNIPDDIFMSDGPWGIDDSQISTTVNNYNISQNEIEFESNDFPIERNLVLNATTSTYFAAYRAITPRFQPVNLTEYNSFKLKAKGTGNLEITFVKQSISNWENQYKTTISLTDNFQDFDIPFSNFQSINGSNLVLDDVVTIVFTMFSEDGLVTTKEMHLHDVRFSTTNTLSIAQLETDSNTIAAYPNPMNNATTIHFKANQVENIQFIVYSQLGKIVYQTNMLTTIGENEIKLNRGSLSSGLYFCKITNQRNYNTSLKLLVK